VHGACEPLAHSVLVTPAGSVTPANTTPITIAISPESFCQKGRISLTPLARKLHF
jgi:hypothetical protein